MGTSNFKLIFTQIFGKADHPSDHNHETVFNEIYKKSSKRSKQEVSDVCVIKNSAEELLTIDTNKFHVHNFKTYDPPNVNKFKIKLTFPIKTALEYFTREFILEFVPYTRQASIPRSNSMLSQKVEILLDKMNYKFDNMSGRDIVRAMEDISLEDLTQQLKEVTVEQKEKLILPNIFSVCKKSHSKRPNTSLSGIEASITVDLGLEEAISALASDSHQNSSTPIDRIEDNFMDGRYFGEPDCKKKKKDLDEFDDVFGTDFDEGGY